MTEAFQDGSVVPDVDVHYLDSKRVGDEFKILVATSPEDPMPPSQVFVVTDANVVYGSALEMAPFVPDG